MRLTLGRVCAFFSACLCGVALSACSHVTAKAAAEPPPLEMPAPPPRDVEPVDVETPAPMPLPEEPARRAPLTRPRPAPRVDAPKADASKPEVKPEPPKPDPAPPIETPKPVEEPPKPATLQTTPTAGEADVERTIRATLAHAATDLRRVNYRTLNVDARGQYDLANRFVHLAEDALSKKNLVMAKDVADKAAGLAAQLAGK